ncbi:MAG: DinB family protein [Herbaspirillum sp.]
MTNVQTLTRYKAWADKLLLSTISQLSENQLVAPQPIVFGNLLRTLHHVYVIDRVWQAHLLGEAHGYTTRNPDSCLPFDTLRDNQLAIDNWYTDYADALSTDKLAETVHFTFIGGGNGSMSRNDILLHVVNHTTYHRGHVADMLYRYSISPPTTDLPVFLRDCLDSA